MKEMNDTDNFLEYTHGKFKFRVKKGLFYSWNDSWAEVLSDGNVRIGITDFLQKNAGDVIFIGNVKSGTVVEQLYELATFESIKTTLDVISPISGTVMESNKHLETDPTVINSDPYGAGWIAVLKPENLDSEKENLMTADAYMEFMKKKIVKEEEKRIN